MMPLCVHQPFAHIPLKVKSSLLVQFRSLRCQEHNLTLVWCRGVVVLTMSATQLRTKDTREVLFYTASTRSSIKPRPSTGPRTSIGGYEIMKTRKTTQEPENGQLYSKVTIQTLSCFKSYRDANMLLL
ncbi:hypothetical protein U9M48_013786 [Paspalum notatum var. saurae]|uniref:Uncharacterized protein n=1 Tax=Paspalum notatum var. saurae TaxID=547442 RepID=A0AAQ3WJV7_PASNO